MAFDGLNWFNVDFHGHGFQLARVSAVAHDDYECTRSTIFLFQIFDKQFTKIPKLSKSRVLMTKFPQGSITNLTDLLPISE